MSTVSASQTKKTRFESIHPILSVRSLADSLKYYIDALGFTRAPWGDMFTFVARDGCRLYLCEGEQGHAGTWVWVGVEDVEALHEEYKARGALIRHPPRNYPWALEFHVEDPDGHILRFGSEPREDQPFDPFVE